MRGGGIDVDGDKEENTRNTELGSSVSGGATILIAHVEASGTMSVEETQKRAREENHKTTRQQSAKLSSEIRNSVKTTFRFRERYVRVRPIGLKTRIETDL